MSLKDKQINRLELVVRAAGDKILQYWPGSTPDQIDQQLKIETKGDGSPVTLADLASNQILIDGIRELWPDDGILSEEIPDRTDLANKNRVWIIDPLDGTRSFISGKDDFSVLVGLSVNGVVEFGMMHFPVKKILALAKKGEGAEINGHKGKVSANNEFSENSVYCRNFAPHLGRHIFEGWMDSGMAFLALCQGELNGIIIKMTSHKEWDIAAPIAIVEESGGKVSDEKGAPIKFTSKELSIGYVVASNGILHEKLLALIPRD